MATLLLDSLDPNRNINELELAFFSQAIQSFVDQGGNKLAKENNLSVGIAFQNFASPVHPSSNTYEREFYFDISNVAKKTTTKNGKTASPAYATLCRLCGILEDYDEGIKLSQLGEFVYKRLISAQEFALLLLSKQNVFLDDVYQVKTLTFFSSFFNAKKILSSNSENAKLELEAYAQEFFRDNQVVIGRRVDLLLNVMKLSGIICSVEDGLRVTKLGEFVFTDFLRCRDLFNNNPPPPKEKEALYGYLCSIDTGLKEILKNNNRVGYYQRFPGLKNVFELEDKQNQCEHQFQDRLTIALRMFEEKRGDAFDPVTQEEQGQFNNDYEVDLPLKKLKTNATEELKDFSVYLNDEEFRTYFPGSLLSRLLVKENPAVYAACAEQTLDALKFLELTTVTQLPNPLTAEVYETLKAAQTQIRDKMHEMKILSQKGKEANYLTVAEFLWFVNDNKDLIEGKVMEKQFKPVNSKPVNEEPRKNTRLKCETTDDVLIFRLMAALRTKPFAILAGHSGTGKSRLVRKLAYMTCNVEELQNKEKNSPENFCMVQVKPNWHDSMDLLGYRSAFEDKSYVTTDVVKFICKAYAYPETPFFLCLDEMNLAPVEQYFAEFLSAMESLREIGKSGEKTSYTSDTLFTLTDDELKSQSKLFDLGCETEVGQTYLTKRGGVTIPKNLFVVGTVNMDETTCQFSRKVLDRAMTIEMTDVNFANFGKVADPSFGDLLAEDIVQLLLNGDIKIEKLDDDDVKSDSKLCRLQKCLKETSFAIAYRFAKEYTLFKRASEEFKKHISGSPQKTEDESSEVAETPEDSKPSEASNSGMRETVENLDALDQMVLMKVLPRIMGRTEDVKALFTGVRDFNPKGSREAMEDSLLDIFGKTSKSGKKMIEIMGRGGSHLTFWP